MASLSCGVYAIVFLKVWSYAQVNHWVRNANFSRLKALKARHISMADLATAQRTSAFSTTSSSAILKVFASINL